mmetsp:Transcript_20646/g.43391  ORF Transcript_20646/g.43391 Transcript_20646/m.43391 type:complete len:272 (+) Transcript_20646:349-1164(+)
MQPRQRPPRWQPLRRQHLHRQRQPAATAAATLAGKDPIGATQDERRREKERDERRETLEENAAPCQPSSHEPPAAQEPAGGGLAAATSQRPSSAPGGLPQPLRHSVLTVRPKVHRGLAALIAREADAVAQALGDGAAVACLADQAVDALLLLPPLLRADVGEVGRAQRRPGLIGEVDDHPVLPHLPVEVGRGLLKVEEERHAALQPRHLLRRDGREPVILEGADGGVLAYAVMQCDRAEFADTSAQLRIAPSIGLVPCNEERTEVAVASKV